MYKAMTRTALAALALCLLQCTETETKNVCDPGYDLDVDAEQCIRQPDSCDPDSPTSIVEACEADHRDCVQGATVAACGACSEGFRDLGGECKPLATCNEIDCDAEQRRCVEGDDRLAASCGECKAGFEEVNGACLRVDCAGTNGSPGLKSACAEESRACVEDTSGASCGGCLTGFVSDDGGCRPAVQCSLLGCVSAGKVCIAAEANLDARCGDCLPGRDPARDCAPIENGSCELTDPGSLAAECAEANEVCEVVAGEARCGACADDYVRDEESGLCKRELTCDDLDCESTNQQCSGSPAQCGECLPNFVRDAAGECLPTKKCEELACDATLGCTEATEIADAFCRPACPDNSVWNGLRCTACPACNGEGEDGVWSGTSAGGLCICRTKPGYYYSVGAEIGTQQCDVDGDGWLKESARNAIQSIDPVVKENARCELRVIDRFELINEGTQDRMIHLETPVALYESDRSDSDFLLQAGLDARNVPRYGKTINAHMKAHDLNRLTKLCHTSTSDYNDNGVPDVSEHAGTDLSPSMLEEHRVFNRFAYFMELHWGIYAAPGPRDQYGRFVIREKSRLAEGGVFDQFRVPARYREGDGVHWRECRVRRDSEWAGGPETGFDLAEFDAVAGWRGMNHHSQFKCFQVNDEVDGATEGMIPKSELLAEYRANTCEATLLSQEPNAGGPVVTCQLMADDEVKEGDVVLAAARYQDHRRLGVEGETIYPWNDGAPTYTRGCVNDCIDRIGNCPGVDEYPDAVSCSYDANNFGRVQPIANAADAMFNYCETTEICDSFDNDSDGKTDEYFPTQGLPCETENLGICKPGTLQCVVVDGEPEVKCVGLEPAPAEICNGEDDDCDGRFDEYAPSGGACSVFELDNDGEKFKTANGSFAMRTGVCGKGEWRCVDGDYTVCYPTDWDDGKYWTNGEQLPAGNFPEAGCDDEDNDCDGIVDECPLESSISGTPHCDVYGNVPSSCADGWIEARRDADGDGYPARAPNGFSVEKSCRCAERLTAPFVPYVAPGVNPETGTPNQEKGVDCCDTCDSGFGADLVHPNASYQPSAACCRNQANSEFDYDCNMTEETLYNQHSSGSCRNPAWGGYCNSIQAGWDQDEKVECGQTRAWNTGSCYFEHIIFGIGRCRPVQINRTQECK